METDFEHDLSGLTGVEREQPRGNFAMNRLLESQTRHVELLSHLASYSELLVAVTGLEGAGKSFIANSLAAQREEPDETLLLTASVMLGMPSILSALASHWDMPAIHEDSVQAREAIKNEAVSRSESGGNLLLIIDQADQLDAETLNDIAHFALLAPQALSVVLFGTPGYETQFRNSPAQAPIHVLGLEPLTDAEINTLVTQVYGDGENCPLSQAELSELMMDSGCLPGPALNHAQRMLSSVARVVPAQTSGFPVKNILAIAGIVTIIAMVGLYQWGAGSAVDNDSVVASENIGEREAVVPAKDFNYPDPQSEGVPETSAVPPTNASTTMTADAASPVEVAAEGAVSQTTASASELQKTEAETSPKVAPPIASQSTDAVLAESGTRDSESSVATTDASAAEKIQPTKPSYTPDERALLAAESGYIVQLLGSFSGDGASKFRQDWKNQVTGTLYQYQTTHQNKDWFVVVSGVYATRNEATAAVNAMPARLRSQSPWVRPVSAAQSAIR